MEEKEKEFPSYQVISEPGTGVYEEKKSRFIANIAPAASEEEALAFIEAIRKKHYDARHNCPAFIIGSNRQITRCSDDGEPSGTAGRPILEVLLGAGVTNVVVVVTRYFGGTLLGTGGLVRAYTQAVQEALHNAKVAVMQYGISMTIGIDYPEVGKVQHLLSDGRIEVTASRYTDKVEIDIRIPSRQEEDLRKQLIESTAGKARIDITGEGYYMITGGG